MRPFDAPEEDNVGGDFDRVLRAALLDAQRSKWAPLLDGPVPEPDFSRRYLRFERKLLNDPFGYARACARPVWQKALRAAVWLLVAASVAIGGLWLNPSTRAWVEQYIFRRLPEVDEYRFQGDPADGGDLSGIRPSYVPEGFVETETLELAGDWYVTYQNQEGISIEFGVLSTAPGGLIGFDNEHSSRSDIKINQWNAVLYTATAPEYGNFLLVFDGQRNCVYTFFSLADADSLVQMAESVKKTN